MFAKSQSQRIFYLHCSEGSIILDHTVETEDLDEDTLPIVVARTFLDSLKENNGSLQFENETLEAIGTPETVIELDDGREIIGKTIDKR